ncbi:sensor histidine kinase [Streptomyces spiramenti]|uniref:histidine kinase n=1 Tax=Streptomyces spiramenti TaxID=2720606 RepID=A0ABX1AJG3_9ACTN|nr:histidine kinase [Streptomyces spiramenti]NJP65816.1 histidine kinase [Streptomyces spiramenti]
MIRSLRARLRLRHALIAPAVALLLVLLFLEAANPPAWAVRVGYLAAGAGVLGALLVPRYHLARAATGAVLVSGAVTLVAGGLQNRADNTPGMTELLLLLCLGVRVVRQLRPARATALMAGVAAAVVLMPLRLQDWGDGRIEILLLVLVLVMPLVVVLGLCLRLYDALRARQREAVLQAQRIEYARDLHDFVAHHVTAIVARTRAARFTAESQSPEAIDRMLAEIEDAGSQALGSMRAMVSHLRDTAAPAGPAPAELAALRELTDEFSAGGVLATLHIGSGLGAREVPAEIAGVAHRVVREALTNARKYARGARHVGVAVDRAADSPDRLVVEVTDDAAATDNATDDGAPAGSGGGFGLMGLTERVAAAGGTLTSGPRERGGWSVRAELPLRARGR